MSFWNNLIMWSIIFMVMGMSAYAIDLKWGVKLYGKIRKWWQPPTANVPDVDRGFIYNRSNKTRWKYASILSAIWAAVMIGIRHEDPRTALIVMLVLPFATFLGFLLGPLKLRIKKVREEGFEMLDKVESGEVDVSERVSESATLGMQKASTLFGNIRGTVTSLFASKPKETAKPAFKPKTSEERAAEAARAREELNQRYK